MYLRIPKFEASRGSSPSQRANEATNKSGDKARILTALMAVNVRGYTPYECESFVKRRSTASSRCEELQKVLLAIASGEERKTSTGCYAQVLIHRVYAEQWQVDKQMESNIIFKITKIMRYQRFLVSKIFRDDEQHYLDTHPHLLNMQEEDDHDDD